MGGCASEVNILEIVAGLQLTTGQKSSDMDRWEGKPSNGLCQSPRQTPRATSCNKVPQTGRLKKINVFS